MLSVSEAKKTQSHQQMFLQPVETGTHKKCNFQGKKKKKIDLWSGKFSKGLSQSKGTLTTCQQLLLSSQHPLFSIFIFNMFSHKVHLTYWPKQASGQDRPTVTVTVSVTPAQPRERSSAAWVQCLPTEGDFVPLQLHQALNPTGSSGSSSLLAAQLCPHQELFWLSSTTQVGFLFFQTQANIIAWAKLSNVGLVLKGTSPTPV